MKLKVKDISKNYNRYSALRGVNLELEPGLYGLLGPNGAGKSTLLKIIAGILRPTAGSILLDNEPVSKLGEHYRAMLGYMPQDLGIYPEFTAKRYLLYIAALKGLTEAQAKAEIDKLLEAVGLSSNAEQKMCQQIIEACKQQDSEKLKSLFSEESKKNIENLDTEISAFFDYIEGSIQRFEGDCASSSESNYGKRKTELDGMYLILTEKERYCMNFYMYSQDDENAQNVGIYKIEIALESEVAEDNFIWDNPPNGIFVGGQN